MKMPFGLPESGTKIRTGMSRPLSRDGMVSFLPASITGGRGSAVSLFHRISR